MMRERSGTSGSAAGGSGGPGMESLPPRQPDYMSVCLFAEEPYQKLAMETLEELDWCQRDGLQQGERRDGAAWKPSSPREKAAPGVAVRP